MAEGAFGSMDLSRSVGPSAVLNPDDLFAVSDAAFVEAITRVQARLGRSVLVGLSGAQGSGKSTSARRLAARLGAMGFKVAVCSLDDFYFTRGERLRLAAQVHPLLQTRGVPGTHDVALMEAVISALLAAAPTSCTRIPSFDKGCDDRSPMDAWPCHEGSTDIVLLEGWCVATRPQPDQLLREAVNALERVEDPAGTWRQFVNHRLATDYARLFSRFDLKLMLRAPSFACVHGWRAEQERDLAQTAGATLAMDADQLARFVAHYERITRWIIEDEPADIIADLDEVRVPVRLRLAG